MSFRVAILIFWFYGYHTTLLCNWFLGNIGSLNLPRLEARSGLERVQEKKRRQMKRGEREREADGWSNRKVSRVGLAYYEYNFRLRLKLKLT